MHKKKVLVSQQLANAEVSANEVNGERFHPNRESVSVRHMPGLAAVRCEGTKAVSGSLYLFRVYTEPFQGGQNNTNSLKA